MEGIGDLGMGDAELFVDEQEFENPRRIGRQQVDLKPHLRHDDLDTEADVRDLVQDLSGTLDGHPRLAGDHRDETGLHTGQSQHNRDLLVGDPLFEDLVLGAVGSNRIVAVVDFFAQANEILSYLHSNSFYLHLSQLRGG